MGLGYGGGDAISTKESDLTVGLIAKWKEAHWLQIDISMQERSLKEERNHV